MSGAPYDREHDPYWQLIEANYRPEELRALVLWADGMEELERRREARGWSRKA